MGRSGYLVNNLSGELAYKSFCPSPLPPSPPIEVDEEMQELLVSTHKSVVKLNTMAENIPDMDLFIGMYVRKEALLSSQIEGTQTTMEDIFDPYMAQNANQDVKEVIRYIQASDFAYSRVKELPLSLRLFREFHQALLNSGRGEEKNPGEFRNSQNWIGPKGNNLKTAIYIPPNVQDMKESLKQWEEYIHSEEDQGNSIYFFS
jgi:Fic family protein